LEAAGFVLSDVAALVWEFTRDRHGFAAFADLTAPQLIRWESRYGWTRSGCGKTSGKEISLARVLASMPRTADMWTGFAESYLNALDHLASAERRSPASKRGYDFYSGSGSTYARDHRTDCLAEWHQTLFGSASGLQQDPSTTSPLMPGEKST